jgi:hypothetical protein
VSLEAISAEAVRASLIACPDLVDADHHFMTSAGGRR